MDKRTSDIVKTALAICTLLNLLLFIAYIVVGITVFGGSACPIDEYIFGNGLGRVKTYSQKITHDFENKQLTVLDNSNAEILSGSIAGRIDFDDYSELTVKRLNDAAHDFEYTFKPKSRAANIKFVMKNNNGTKQPSNEITCDTYEWLVVGAEKSYAPQEFEDCFELADAYWYGQTESKDQQYWPINNMVWTEYKPFLSGFIDDWGSILERYWLSTKGIAIIVDRSVPLFVRKNQTSVCFLSTARNPYDDRKRDISLKYDICRIEASRSKRDFLNKLHLYVINNYYAKPVDIPDERMFKSPIWSTWANFKANINESVVLNYAQEIKNNGYPNSQLEIDDKWQTTYGDFNFDKSKFPNIADMITELNRLGYRTTLWIHPFTNLDSLNIWELGENFLAVRTRDSLLPGLTSWWQGPAAIIFDTTNPNSTNWFVDKLEAIRRDAKIDSFKFDAGELNWLPQNFELANAETTPDEYCTGFARMSARFGKLIEVRVGCRTQDLPIFVRMLDKDSNWGYNNGLKSVLTTSLTMSILGYPFILPDMIGGNAYVFEGEIIDFNGIAYPEYELYVRWAQMTAFLPSMQFSIPPWYYNDKTTVPVNQICKRYVDLHENLIYPLLIKYARISTQTGEPIIRPIWWIDNSDVTSQNIPDEFLIGTEILVAPVTDEKAVQRDVYLPVGKWKDEGGREFEGPIWLRNYSAPIETIPYFIAI